MREKVLITEKEFQTIRLDDSYLLSLIGLVRVWLRYPPGKNPTLFECNYECERTDCGYKGFSFTGVTEECFCEEFSYPFDISTDIFLKSYLPDYRKRYKRDNVDYTDHYVKCPHGEEWIPRNYEESEDLISPDELEIINEFLLTKYTTERVPSQLLEELREIQVRYGLTFWITLHTNIPDLQALQEYYARFGFRRWNPPIKHPPQKVVLILAPSFTKADLETDHSDERSNLESDVSRILSIIRYGTPYCDFRFGYELEDR